MDFLDWQAYLGHTFVHPGGRDLTEAMLARLRLSRKSRVLDLGCGTGATALLIARQTGAYVVGLERASAMLREATARRQRAPKRLFDLVQADAGRMLPFRDRTFDAIYAESVVALLDAELVIAECVRALKPGCTLALVERIWKPGVSRALAAKVNAVSRRAFGIPAATPEPWAREDWLALLSRVGLVQRQALAVDALLPRQRASEPLALRLRRLSRYLLRPTLVWRAVVYRRAMQRHATLFTHLDSYLFVARKPES
jgi:SAM-dependent methyltransferase